MGEWRRSGWLAFALLGCGGTELPNDDTTCDPGVVIECPCAGGQAGVQRCRDDGAGYEACQCPGAAASSGVTTAATTAQGTGGETTNATSGPTTASAGGGGSGGEGTGAGGATSGSTVSAGGGGSGGDGGAGGTGGATSSSASVSSSSATTSASTSTSASSSASISSASATTTSGSGGAGGDGPGGGGAGGAGTGGGNGGDLPLFDAVIGSANPGTQVLDMEVAPDGSIYLLLWTALTSYQGFDFDGESLLKLNADGSLAWGLVLDDLGGNGAISLDITGDVLLTASFSGVLDFGGDIVIGDVGSEVAVGRWDSDGNLLATAGFVLAGNNPALPQDVVVADDGTVVIVGSYQGTLDVGGSPLASQGAQPDSFLIALDPGLDPLWARNATNMRLKSLVATSDGDVVAAGFGYGAMSVLGLSANTGGSSDFALLRFGLAPAGQWLRRYGGPAEETLISVRSRADGGLLLFGSLFGGGRADFGLGELLAPGEYSGFLAGLTSEADPLFSRLFVGNSAVTVLDASSDASSNAMIVGDFAGTMDVGGDQLISQGVRDAWLAAIAPNGAPMSARRYGGSQYDFLYRVVAEPGGTLVIAGGTLGTIDLGSGPLSTETGAVAAVFARIPAP